MRQWVFNCSFFDTGSVYDCVDFTDAVQLLFDGIYRYSTDRLWDAHLTLPYSGMRLPLQIQLGEVSWVPASSNWEQVCRESTAYVFLHVVAAIYGKGEQSLRILASMSWSSVTLQRTYAL